MILSIHTEQGSYQCELDEGEYLKLRQNRLDKEALKQIAQTLGIPYEVFVAYSASFASESANTKEFDYSCDYTDQSL